jgi:hypothetical protein
VEDEADAQRRWSPWQVLLVGALAVLAVVLKELGTLVLRAQQPEDALGTGVFTGLSFRTDRLMQAAGPDGVWQKSEDRALGLFVSAHLTVDLVFAVVLGLALYWVLRSTVHASGDLRVPMFFASAYMVCDVGETVITKVLFECPLLGWGHCEFGITGGQASVIHVLSGLKWLTFAGAIVVIMVCYLLPGVEGRMSLQRSLSRREARTSPGLPVGLVVLVVLFLALLALPAGGPLDQFPDVIRAQIDAFDVGGRLESGLSVLLLAWFVLTVAVVGAAGTRSTGPSDVGWCIVLLVAAVTTLGLAVAYVVLAEEPGWQAGLPVLAPLLTVGGVLVLSWVVNFARGHALPTVTSPDDQGADSASEEPLGQVNAGPIWLAALVVMGAGIGLVRATLPVVAIPDDSPTAYTPLLIIGLALPTLGSTLVAWAVSITTQEAESDLGRIHWALLALVAVPSMAAAVVLARNTDVAAEIGAPATMLVCLSAYAVVVGGFTLLRGRWVWRVGEPSVLGRRTPWLGFVVVSWLVAGQLDLPGGYHDARTTEADGVTSKTDLQTSFEKWADAWDSMPPDQLRDCAVGGGGTVPLVLVAAPGGGAKAAYWTATGMDLLFGQEGYCTGSLFAASGVSGGAVGLTTRLAIAPPEPRGRLSTSSGDLPDVDDDREWPVESSARAAAERMTVEGPLAATLAAMLLRDTPQPFTALRSNWPDRAAVLENTWSDSTDVFTAADGDLRFDQLGSGWWAKVPPSARNPAPLLLLNGTSVTDGCRALVANVDGLAIDSGSCLDDGFSGTRPVSAANDLLSGLLPSTAHDGGSQGREPGSFCGTDTASQTLRATTAALLSARFPYVTPSGALRRCDGKDVTATYVVDGGYLENTGLLTLLQVWEAVEQSVEACNRLKPNADRVGCPGAVGQRLVIEPWLVLLENHYPGSGAPPPPTRPRELLIPPLTVAGKRGITLSTPALEQIASWVMSRDFGGGSCPRYVRLAPGVRAEVQAPLGWVLADSTRLLVDRAMRQAWRNALERHPCSFGR